jgi:hypothetical protein
MEDRQREALMRLAVSMRKNLAAVVDELDIFIRQLGTEGTVECLTAPDGKLLAEIFESADQLEFKIAEVHQIPLNDVSVQNFLIKKVLVELKKRGIAYTLDHRNGLLKTIMVKGDLTEEDVKTLKRTIAWTILKVQRGEADGRA